MKNKKALITGCFGSVGTYMTEWLERERQDVDVHGIGRAASGLFKDTGVRRRAHIVDLRCASAIEAILRRESFDVIFHFASDADVAGSFENSVGVLDNNVLSTAVLFEAVRQTSPEAVVVLASTSEVYGVCENGLPVDEHAPIAPANPYAVSKAAQDLLAFVCFKAYGVRIVRVRMFTYFNPRRHNLFSSAFARQIAEIEVGKRRALTHGNLESIRTFIDIDDCCSAYWLAYEKGIPGEAYNVGSEIPHSVGDVLKEIVVQARRPVTCVPDKALFRPTDVKAQIPVCRKFRDCTGWTPRVPLQESIAKLLDYYRAAATECKKAS